MALELLPEIVVQRLRYEELQQKAKVSHNYEASSIIVDTGFARLSLGINDLEDCSDHTVEFSPDKERGIKTSFVSPMTAYPVEMGAMDPNEWNIDEYTWIEYLFKSSYSTSTNSRYIHHGLLFARNGCNSYQKSMQYRLSHFFSYLLSAAKGGNGLS